MIMPMDGPARVLCVGGGPESTFEMPGWDVLRTFVDRFAPDVSVDLSTRFAATIAEWEANPTRVTYGVVGGRDVLVGLSYQTSPEEVLAAVWRGLCVSLARTLRDNGVDGPVRLESGHPGADVLADRLSRLGVRVQGVRTPVDAEDRVRIDALVRAVADTAREVSR
ncbi:hypothetical protein DLJ61_14990 [Gordonia terrae]|uniref:Uncharacterized protein n=1 Tax=Gordonia terrae TaxID=2055 RepID=A0AAD0K7L5_9ACTN|nr:hypothetical protein BCM27_14840 [Gordonia terrae]AWO84629.1 hypothetical protein DLJ61_14990 [Gordonia terrae]